MAGHRGNGPLVPTAWVLLLMMISAMLLGKGYFHLLKVHELRPLPLSLSLEAKHVLSDWIQSKEQNICKQMPHLFTNHKVSDWSMRMTKSSDKRAYRILESHHAKINSCFIFGISESWKIFFFVCYWKILMPIKAAFVWQKNYICSVLIYFTM